MPDIVNFNTEISDDTFELEFSTDVVREENIAEEEIQDFDQLHAKAVQQRFISVDEMKFLILVNKFLDWRRNVKMQQIYTTYNPISIDSKRRKYNSLTVFGFAEFVFLHNTLICPNKTLLTGAGIIPLLSGLYCYLIKNFNFTENFWTKWQLA